MCLGAGGKGGCEGVGTLKRESAAYRAARFQSIRGVEIRFCICTCTVPF